MISASIAAIHARCSAPCRTHSVTRPQTRRHSSWQPCHTTSFRQPARLQRSNDRHQHSHRIRVAEIDAHPVHVCSAPAIDMVDYQAGVYTIYGSLHTKLAEADVLDVLTDYPGLARIYNNIENSRLLLDGSQKQVVQTCRWEFLVFSGNFEMRLTVHEARQHGEVVFNLISSSFMRQFQGAWKVTVLPQGGCKVQHRLNVQPSLAPPEAFAGYTKKIFVRQVERLLEDLSQELCRIQAGN